MNPRAIPLLSLLLLGIAGPALRATRAGDAPDLGAIRRLLEDERPAARAAALRRLAGRPERGARRLLLDGLHDPHPYVRRAAAGVLGTVDEADRPGLGKDLARLKTPEARVAACRVLALWADDRGCRALLDRLEAREAAVRGAAVCWLADDPGEGVAEALRHRLGDRDGEVRALAVDALVRRGDTEVEVEPLLADADWRVRLSALEGSVVGTPPLQGGGRAVVALLHGLDDAVWSVRCLAAELSRRRPDARLLPALVRALADPRRRVAAAAHDALVALTGIPFDPDPETWTHWLETDGVDFDPAARVGEEDPGRPPPPRGGETVARPRFLGLPVVSSHVAFVLDGSGSMARRLANGRSRWEEACASLDRTLGGLGAATGNVFVFQDGVSAAFEKVVRLDRRRKDLAAWLASIHPGGRTALFDGLAAALADEDIDSIVLLSDGAPSAGRFFTKTDLLTEVARLNRWRRARIDVVSVGTEGLAKRWRDVLRRLAEDSGGEWIQH